MNPAGARQTRCWGGGGAHWLATNTSPADLTLLIHKAAPPTITSLAPPLTASQVSATTCCCTTAADTSPSNTVCQPVPESSGTTGKGIPALPGSHHITIWPEVLLHMAVIRQISFRYQTAVREHSAYKQINQSYNNA